MSACQILHRFAQMSHCGWFWTLVEHLVQTLRLQCNLIMQKIIDGSMTYPLRHYAAAKQSHCVPAISKPGAMHSNCNSVSIHQHEVADARATVSSFGQPFQSCACACFCAQMVQKLHLEYIWTPWAHVMSLSYVTAVITCHLSLFAQFFWVFNRKAWSCMFSFRWKRLFELCSKTTLNMRLNIKHNVLCNFGQFRQMTWFAQIPTHHLSCFRKFFSWDIVFWGVFLVLFLQEIRPETRITQDYIWTNLIKITVSAIFLSNASEMFFFFLKWHSEHTII